MKTSPSEKKEIEFCLEYQTASESLGGRTWLKSIDDNFVQSLENQEWKLLCP